MNDSFKRGALALIVASVWSAGLVLAQAPIPKVLREAKTAFLVNTGVKPPAFDRLAKDLQAWKRFKLVDDEKVADIVISVAPPNRNSGGGSMSLSVTTPAEHTLIYGDTTGPIWTESSAVSKLVKRLRERLEAPPSAPEAR